MFDEIGTKIQVVAKVLAWIGIYASIIVGAVLFAVGLTQAEELGYLMVITPFVIALGCLLSWLSNIVLYGFGKLIEDVEKIRYNMTSHDIYDTEV